MGVAFTIVLLKLLGLLGGCTMFAFGIADSNGALTLGGMLVVVFATLLGPRRRESADHN
jgi:LPXTG-motif cell wall-anchored protein